MLGGHRPVPGSLFLIEAEGVDHSDEAPGEAFGNDRVEDLKCIRRRLLVVLVDSNPAPQLV